MWVKICGITNLEDALCALNAGADALGFVFYPKSPRYITPENAKNIAEQLPMTVKKIGLFVEASPEEIGAVCKEAHMDMAQIHFEVDDAFWSALKVPYLRVVRAKETSDIEEYKGLIRLIDAHVEGYGGAGQRLDLSWFEHADCENIILAGGLSPENVEQVKPLGFYGVDVSSGVERAKGLKDHEKVEMFLKRAKA
ncbi:phosphoribosylanthranilate isomerase [Sulfurospirillum sp. UCH001]|uniref:phosphoribosylanthranilate isomerase n=1 Tax=Sulfurospirillum sp. UCH001 TaxID=1581011 RepID=UPI00082BEB2B|nr:phosphoribosylanthranilate isomerase [Sulfurospirillum sp. UCH001]